MLGRRYQHKGVKMGLLERFGGSALKYYQTILSAAYKNLSNSDMWAAIHRQAANYGLPSPQTQPPDASVIRGFANRIVNGARNLAAAQPTDTITSDMMWYAPYTSRDYNAITTDPKYQVRYKVFWQTSDGTINDRWNTSVFNASNFPGTVGELQDTIDFNASELLAQAAQQTGDKSGGTLLSTEQLEITLVLCDGRSYPLPQQQRFVMDPASGTHTRHRNTHHPRHTGSARTTVLARACRFPARKPAASR